MSTLNLLFKDRYRVTPFLEVMIPTVGDVLEQEDSYYAMISMITATPIDMMVQLDDAGIDFTTIDDFGLFLMVFEAIKDQDTSLVFGDLDLRKFLRVVDPKNSSVILRNPETGDVIDRGIYMLLCQAVRKIHHLERNNRKPANEEARKYMLERARKKMKRHRNRVEDSQLEELIVALVNTEQFHYGFADVRDLTIYQFNESVRQVIKKVDFDNKMHGVYAGTISAKDLSQDDLNWLTHK